MATDVDPLESWKEIAAYLKRDVTTVQRWEKREGLPIHRHLHDKSGSVFALKHELDRWRRARTRTPEVAGDLPIGSDSEAEAGAASRGGVAPPPLVTGPLARLDSAQGRVVCRGPRSADHDGRRAAFRH
jgi:hypothetical protein